MILTNGQNLMCSTQNVSTQLLRTTNGPKLQTENKDMHTLSLASSVVNASA